MYHGLNSTTHCTIHSCCMFTCITDWTPLHTILFTQPVCVYESWIEPHYTPDHSVSLYVYMYYGLNPTTQHTTHPSCMCTCVTDWIPLCTTPLTQPVCVHISWIEPHYTLHHSPSLYVYIYHGLNHTTRCITHLTLFAGSAVLEGIHPLPPAPICLHTRWSRRTRWAQSLPTT